MQPSFHQSPLFLQTVGVLVTRITNPPHRHFAILPVIQPTISQPHNPATLPPSHSLTLPPLSLSHAALHPCNPPTLLLCHPAVLLRCLRATQAVANFFVQVGLSLNRHRVSLQIQSAR